MKAPTKFLELLISTHRFQIIYFQLFLPLFQTFFQNNFFIISFTQKYTFLTFSERLFKTRISRKPRSRIRPNFFYNLLTQLPIRSPNFVEFERAVFEIRAFFRTTFQTRISRRPLDRIRPNFAYIFFLQLSVRGPNFVEFDPAVFEIRAFCRKTFYQIGRAHV